MQKDTVLGLSVGTKLMGLAYVRNGILEDWQVKTFDGKWNRNKQKAIVRVVDRHIERYGIKKVILKVPGSCRSSPAVHALTQALICLCERKSIPVSTCTINRLKDMCEVNNKTELMQATLVHFPELTYLLAKTRETQKIYYVKIFEAVLATLL